MRSIAMSIHLLLLLTLVTGVGVVLLTVVVALKKATRNRAERVALARRRRFGALAGERRRGRGGAGARWWPTSARRGSRRTCCSACSRTSGWTCACATATASRTPCAPPGSSTCCVRRLARGGPGRPRARGAAARPPAPAGGRARRWSRCWTTPTATCATPPCAPSACVATDEAAWALVRGAAARQPRRRSASSSTSSQPLGRRRAARRVPHRRVRPRPRGARRGARPGGRSRAPAPRSPASCRFGSEEERVRCCRALGRAADPAMAPLVAAALQDEAWSVRAQAARALGAMRADRPRDRRAARRRALRPGLVGARATAPRRCVAAGPDGRAALEAALASDDRFARERAREALELRARPRGGPRRVTRIRASRSSTRSCWATSSC